MKILTSLASLLFPLPVNRVTTGGPRFPHDKPDNVERVHIVALQGELISTTPIPRALPWAILRDPFGVLSSLYASERSGGSKRENSVPEKSHPRVRRDLRPSPLVPERKTRLADACAKSLPGFKAGTIVLGILFLTSTLFAQDHGHLQIGAVSPTQGGQLYFYNGNDFRTNTYYVKTLDLTNSGRYSGYYQGNITLTVQAATAAFGGPEANAPALGSYIRANIAAVDGPPGGAFAFWEAGANSPTISVACGTTNAASFNVTQTDGTPGVDPFGHIHGRRMSATKPGIYVVTFRAFDTSTNGIGGGPIHTPSDLIRVYFEAGVNIASIEPDVDHTHIRFGCPVGANWQLEGTDALATNTVWNPIGTAVAGVDYFVEVREDRAVSGNRFYRIRKAP